MCKHETKIDRLCEALFCPDLDSFARCQNPSDYSERIVWGWYSYSYNGTRREYTLVQSRGIWRATILPQISHLTCVWKLGSVNGPFVLFHLQNNNWAKENVRPSSGVAYCSLGLARLCDLVWVIFARWRVVLLAPLWPFQTFAQVSEGWLTRFPGSWVVSSFWPLPDWTALAKVSWTIKFLCYKTGTE